VQPKQLGITPLVQRQVEEEEEELQTKPLPGAADLAFQRQDEGQEEEPLQAKREAGRTPSLTSAVESSIVSQRGSGKSLPDSERAFFGSRFDHDFSGVRVHADSQAGILAKTVQARAFTVGRDIFFGQGEYSPGSLEGRKLLAHELTHVVQQEGGGAALQNQADIDQAPPGLPCALVTGAGHLDGPNVLFDRSSTNLSVAERVNIANFVDNWIADGSRDSIQVDGYASVDGPQSLNWRLSCSRAEAVRDELVAQGVPVGQITIVAHGETTEFSTDVLALNRRAIISRQPSAGPPAPAPRPPAPAPPAAVPQLSATIVTGPTPGNCGVMNFVIRWSISGNSAPNGGFVIQDITFTWNNRDCSGREVPDASGKISPLRYFEAWRIRPNSTTFDPADGSTDTFSWVNDDPTGCTIDRVRIRATARYHDNVSVASMPAQMTRNNAATFAGVLRSSLTDPALGGNISAPVPHSLIFNWTCCPCTSSPTVVESHTP